MGYSQTIFIPHLFYCQRKTQSKYCERFCDEDTISTQLMRSSRVAIVRLIKLEL